MDDDGTALCDVDMEPLALECALATTGYAVTFVVSFSPVLSLFMSTGLLACGPGLLSCPDVASPGRVVLTHARTVNLSRSITITGALSLLFFFLKLRSQISMFVYGREATLDYYLGARE